MDATNSSANDTTANAAGSLANDATTTTDTPCYDEPYRFGRRPTSRAPFPFTEREFARLLVVRSRLEARNTSDDTLEA